MRIKLRVAYAAGGLAAAAVVSASGYAHAALCSSYNSGNVVYFAGSTAVQPVLQTLASSFAAAAPPINIGVVYQSVGSCQGIGDVLTPTLEKKSGLYLDPVTGKAIACDLTDTINGQAPDIAVSDVFPATCTATNNTPAVGSGFKEFVGPIQVFAMVTRKESSESSISADAAYTIFGFGGVSPYGVAPWTDSTQMFIRAPTSGTINMIGTAIGLSASKWLVGTTFDAQRKAGSGAVLSALQTATNANASIGILAADFADPFRNPSATDGGAPPPAIKILAYKHKGQSCGYLPDSDSTHYDKINVRQGRYAIWGPVHFVTAVDATGKAKNANVATILQYFESVGKTPDQTLTTAQKKAMIDAEADAFTVPWCAMQVERSGEISTPTTFAPTEPCGCYFESHKASPVTTCKACLADTPDCSGSTPKCRYGFCEAK